MPKIDRGGASPNQGARPSPHVPSSRRLAAIVFTDIVGFTRLAQRDERGALRARAEYQRLLGPILATHGGREVKSLGDGFLLDFPSAVESVRSALAVQRELHARNGPLPAEERIEVRIGVHVGDVVQEGDDLLGDAVNIASRVQAAAEPGGIWVTGAVRDQVGNKLPVVFEPLGTREFKNVDLPPQLFRVLGRPTPAASGREGARAQDAPTTRIAVLPFANLSRDTHDEYFADGLTEELISELSRTAGLEVIARTSVLRFKGGAKGIREAGSELNVQVVLEGSVRKAENRIRVTAQLVDVGTEGHLWSDRYDRELTDIFAIQSEIAGKVASSLTSGPLKDRRPRATKNVEAYVSFLRGAQLLHDGTPANLREALVQFERALEIDPGFARAHAAVAITWATLVTAGHATFEDVRERSEPEALRALELGPDEAEPHAVMAQVHLMLDRRQAAMAEARAALAIDPNLAGGHEILGQLEVGFGDLAHGLASYRRAHELDPIEIRTGLNYAWAAHLGGDVPTAREVLERMERLHPTDARVPDAWAEFHQLRGDLPEAERILKEAMTRHPSEFFLRTDLAVNYALQGRRQEAEAMLSESLADPNAESRTASVLWVRSALGDVDLAFAALDEMAVSHAWPWVIEIHPLFAKVRADPRFRSFQRKVGHREP